MTGLLEELVMKRDKLYNGEKENLYMLKGSSKIGYEQAPSEDLETIIQMYQDGVFAKELQKAVEAQPALAGNSSLIPITSETREADMRSQEKQIATLVTDKGKEDSHIDK